MLMPHQLEKYLPNGVKSYSSEAANELSINSNIEEFLLENNDIILQIKSF